ncbi:histone-lysine N-methyltransferase 2D-like protein [Lates japonicus]|uniref:Histone-lysine N-methyltransferase 2D-like protein n=1 Tax=Lates japonicus TaxID=270547 RepID=A0AAD3M7G0_LATJO|nr:histone-lysine N-methyltransferase 2D-like protein [Lates japonicus]
MAVGVTKKMNRVSLLCPPCSFRSLLPLRPETIWFCLSRKKVRQGYTSKTCPSRCSTAFSKGAETISDVAAAEICELFSASDSHKKVPKSEAQRGLHPASRWWIVQRPKPALLSFICSSTLATASANTGLMRQRNSHPTQSQTLLWFQLHHPLTPVAQPSVTASNSPVLSIPSSEPDCCIRLLSSLQPQDDQTQKEPSTT